MIRVGVVVPVLNQFDLAIDMIASIKSIHEVQTFVIPQYRLNQPLSAAWNQGALKAFSKGCDYVLVCNDDILLAPSTIDIMVDEFMSTDDFRTVMVTGRNINDGSHQPNDVLSMLYVDGDIQENPDFSCFMIDAATQKHIGRFDENFKPAYFEDNDYHRRILLAGQMAYNVPAPFFHYGSRTQNANPNDPVVPPAWFEKNRAYYMQKWGGGPGEETFQTPFNDPDKTIKDW